MPRRPIRVVVAGLDLSLTGAGVAVLDPLVWDLDVDRVQSARFGYKLAGSNATADHEARADRLVAVPDLIVDFLADRSVTHVWVENYSFGMQHAAHQLGEMGGCVKRELRKRLGIVAIPVSNSTARKLFLGRGSGSGIKEAVVDRLADLEWGRSVDEGDALVVANYGLSELGFPALTVAR